MKNWNRLYSAAAGLLAMVFVAGLGVPNAFGQMGSMNRYTVTTFSGTWIDATGGTYLGSSDDGWYNFTAPFSFPYDSTVISAGHGMSCTDDGNFSISSLSGNPYYVK